MQRILVLEDDLNRIKWFEQAFIGKVVDFTDSAKEAIELLKKKNYSHLFLDHDLWEVHYTSDIRDDHNTGYAVAKFLELHPSCCENAEIIIHSMNPSGSGRMLYALQKRKVRHIMFPQLMKLMNVE